MSQSNLAQAMNVSRSLIKHIEHGRASIGQRERVHRFALVLRCKPTELLPEADDAKNAMRTGQLNGRLLARAIDAFGMMLTTADDAQEMSVPAIAHTSKD